MKKRDINSYNIIFSHVSEKINSYKGFIISDFEPALVSSLKINFEHSKINGCYFHFSQIIWRKIQQLNLQLDYKNDPNFRKMVRLIILLSYVPTENINLEFKKIEDLYGKNEKNMDFLKYFEHSFVQKNLVFYKSVSFWSVHERIKKNIPTTTNSVEAWHRHLNTFVSKNSENLGKIIDILKTQDQKAKILKENLLAGNYSPSSRSNKLRNIVVNYPFYINLEYLDSINKIVNFKFK
ncbi:hypothetical protein DMUE_0953 [Dictyocoela muelleri]|nr:hypothetical protein DMUE_0953 [Dictyocoela muelleri]